MPTITFTKEKKEIQVPAGANLRAEALRAGVRIHPGIQRFLNAASLGLFFCCRVRVTKGMENTSKKGLVESGLLAISLAAIGHEKDLRMAGCTTVDGDITVETTPPMNLFGDNFFS